MASAGAQPFTYQELSALTCIELKAHLRNLGLCVSGNKIDLICRILEHQSIFAQGNIVVVNEKQNSRHICNSSSELTRFECTPEHDSHKNNGDVKYNYPRYSRVDELSIKTPTVNSTKSHEKVSADCFVNDADTFSHTILAGQITDGVTSISDSNHFKNKFEIAADLEGEIHKLKNEIS